MNKEESLFGLKTLGVVTVAGMGCMGWGAGPFAGKQTDLWCGGGEALYLAGIGGLLVETTCRLAEKGVSTVRLRIENIDIH